MQTLSSKCHGLWIYCFFLFCGYLSISSDWEWERTLKNDSSKRSNRSQANRDDGERERRAHLRDVPIRPWLARCSKWRLRQSATEDAHIVVTHMRLKTVPKLDFDLAFCMLFLAT